MVVSDNIKKWIAVIIMIAISMCLIATAKAQDNVILKGKTFIQESPKQDSVKTDYEYQDRDGAKHTIYLSPKGKAYYWATSKKTGRRYKRYLPKITEMLKEAEK